MESDSFIYCIRTENFYEDIRQNIDSEFDTSDYNPENIHHIPLRNKRIFGMMKDENSGKIMR